MNMKKRDLAMAAGGIMKAYEGCFRGYAVKGSGPSDLARRQQRPGGITTRELSKNEGTSGAWSDGFRYD